MDVSEVVAFGFVSGEERDSSVEGGGNHPTYFLGTRNEVRITVDGVGLRDGSGDGPEGRMEVFCTSVSIHQWIDDTAPFNKGRLTVYLSRNNDCLLS